MIPRVFMDDTSEDREAILPLVNQIMVYPLEQYTGESRTTDWSDVPTFDAGDAAGSEQETQWVVPEQFFATLPDVLDEVPPRPGEEALYAWFRSLLDAAATDAQLAEALAQAAVDADIGLVRDLSEFRNIGIPVDHHWSTQKNGATFGTDYLSRTSMARANIFVNTPSETAYFYQDLDETGERLNGANAYTVTFSPGELPPVDGFWSLTLYNQHHFFAPNELDRYSLGTKNQHQKTDADGSLTLHVSAQAPADASDHANWLPAPSDDFSLYLRAYWPQQRVLDGNWTPPPVQRQA